MADFSIYVGAVKRGVSSGIRLMGEVIIDGIAGPPLPWETADLATASTRTAILTAVQTAAEATVVAEGQAVGQSIIIGSLEGTKDFYAQDADPGAVGAGSVWKDTTATPYIWHERTFLNDGWDQTAIITVVAFGVGEDASVLAQATADDGEVDVRRLGDAYGSGNATGNISVIAHGSGSSDASGYAYAMGAGDARVEDVAWTEEGVAYSSAISKRASVKAGIESVVDATSARMGFFGVTPVAKAAANADTSGATLANLEIEVNELKALLRAYGLLAT